jgi:hypothetical protein
MDSATFIEQLTKSVEALMSEAWILELLGTVRDVARSQAMIRLAEHLDDAMLVAASEYHEAMFAADLGKAHVFESTNAVRSVAGPGIH